jgi:hypothetical protein
MGVSQIARLSLFFFVSICAFSPNPLLPLRRSWSSTTLGMEHWNDLNYISTSGILNDLKPEIPSYHPLSGWELLIENFRNLLSSAVPSLGSGVAQILDRIQFEVYGAWYVAAICLLLAAVQREAGREEAFREFRDKIWRGEITVEEVGLFVSSSHEKFV